MNIENLNKKSFKNNKIKIDYSGIGILVGITIQAFAILPLIIRVHQTKSAEDISYVTPIMFLLAFILFTIISLVKVYFVPLIIYFIGIIFSSILLAQKYMYEQKKKAFYTKRELVYDLKMFNKDQRDKLRKEKEQRIFDEVMKRLDNKE